MKRVGFWPEAPTSSGGSLICMLMDLAEAVGLVTAEQPTPFNSIDAHWLDTSQGREEFKQVLMHLKRGMPLNAYFGYATCRICGRENGCKDKTDGEYVWPEGYYHYVSEHAVKPPIEFIQHVMRQERV